MALHKSKTLRWGVTGDYWKINGINVDRATHKVTAMIALHVSSSTKDDPYIPGTGKTYIFSATKEEMQGNLVALCYSKIKQKANTIIKPATLSTPAVYFDEDLKGATDV